MVLIVGGPAANGVDEKLAEITQYRLVKIVHKIFPDGESYIRYPVSVKGEDVVIVQSLYSPQDKHFLELLLMVDAALDLGAERVVAVVPYLAYSRQDRMFLEGEAVSVRTLLKTLKNLGAYAFITVDIHKEYSLKHFGERAYNVTAMEEIAKHIKEHFPDLEKPLVLSPDKGAIIHASTVARILNSEYDYLEKERDRVTGKISVKPKRLSVDGRDVVIVDDIISTGGTIALATESVIKQGAKRVIVGCTHPLLISNAREKLKKAGVSYLVATDTIPSEFSKVSVAPVIAKVLTEIFRE